MAIARIGQLLQYTGPFTNTDNINITNYLVKIGISVDEKEYMPYTTTNTPDLLVMINGREIQIGSTYIYLPGNFLQGVNISFPNGAPTSTKVDILTIAS